LTASNYVVKDSIVEPMRSKRRRVETSFGPDFLTNFLIEDVDINFLSNELVFAFMIEEDQKTYGKAMRSIDVSFGKKQLKVNRFCIV